MSLADTLRDEARRSDLDVLGFASAGPFEGQGLAASRRDPRLALSDARSIIVAGKYIGGAVQEDSGPPSARFGRLTLSGFFSDVIRPLEGMATILAESGYRALICDSGPGDQSVLPLKLAAVRAGLGWQAKNTLLVSRQYGSFLALGSIITNAPLPCVQAVDRRDYCGTCMLCVKSCPLGALEPYRLNRSRCLTHRLAEPGVLSVETIRAMGNRLLDCDRCQDVCPHNHSHIGTHLPARSSVVLGAELNLLELERMKPDRYERFRETFYLPHPFSVFRRNTLAAIASSGLPQAPGLLKAALTDDDLGVSGTARNGLRVLAWRATGVT